MKKKSASQSAFLNFRVIVGLNVFLVGAFLALFAAANPSSRRQPGLAVTAGASPTGTVGTILFNQLTGFTLGYVPAQRFVPPGPIDAEAADDFMVFDSQGWTIGEFKFEIELVGSEPGMVDIRVYPDNNGQPGTPAVCSYNGIAANQHGFEQPVLKVPLPTACVLGQGRYWVSLARSDGSGMKWADGSPDPFPPPFVLGAHGHWRNPGDGFGTGCTDWSDITTCLVEGHKGPMPIGGSGEQFKFQICGTAGMGGSPARCPEQIADVDLAITLAVDNGDPQQCGTATSLAVDAGTRVNTCYTITNAGNATLRYHWLLDHRPPRPFAKNQTLAPGDTVRFNRLITAAESQVITAEAQSTDVIPWYFAVAHNFQFVDISNSGTALNLSDDGSANVVIPFRFDLFGVSANQLCINNNGFILLDWSKPCDGFQDDVSIPNENVPLSAAQIAPFWDDLFTGGNVYYQTVGQAPNRRFIVQWHQKNHYNNGQSDPGGVTFEAILEEGTNNVWFQYLDTTFDNPQHPEWNRGGSATVGFQSYVRDSFGGAWRSLTFHQPQLDPNSALSWPATESSHATATAAATLTVNAPAIVVSPQALNAFVQQGGSTSAPLSLSNAGTRNLQWEIGASPLGPTSHFPSPGVPVVPQENASANIDIYDLMPRERQKLRLNYDGPAPNLPVSFATSAFAVRYAFDTPPFPTLYQRLNDITNPANTEQLGDLVARDIFAGAFIGNDFSRQYAIDDCCANFLTIDTATGEPSINLGRVQHDPSQLARFWGMSWDATTDTLYTVVSNTFSIFSNTRFFLVRIDRGHDPVAVIIGELPGIPQGAAMFGIAVDSIGRMFGIDVLGDRLFAIDKHTAAATPIGPLGFNANGAVGFDFDDATGTLYLTSIDDNAGIANLYTVNTLTGLARVVGALANGNQHSALAIASGAPCVPPTAVPWLSMNPSSGNIAPGGNNTVNANMNASSLSPGTYRADVCVGSNDPVRPLVPVPVILQVTVPISSAASRKTHGSAGPFDVALPVSGTPGIECRNGGATNDYTVVVTFGNNVTVNGNPQAEVTSGVGTVGSGGISNGGMVTVSGNTVTVPLTNVANAQTINITLFDVNTGTVSGNVVIPMSVLVGDVNANRTVNASDVAQIKSRIGQAADATTFRSDVNANGTINASDVSITKSNIGTGLPLVAASDR